MVSFFGSRKRASGGYQGFSKYSNEINEYDRNNYAGLPNNGVSRSDSLSSGAGSAALAALRLHQNSQPVDENQHPNQYNHSPSAYNAYTQGRRQTLAPVNGSRSNSIRRSSSITSNSNIPRSNSLRTYSYHPKGSYTPGQATIPDARRYSSLTSSTSLSNFQQLQRPQRQYVQPPATKRLSSLNSQSSLPKQTLYEENSEEEGETVITTQTTKVVDSQGRVTSVTTKTIKTLPDGSNVIETTTKNISRSNSRNNSLRNNSLIAPNRDPNYNLQKIDEDLQDFEYNYELDNHNQTDHEYPDTDPVDHDLDPDLKHNADSLKLNTDLEHSRNNSIKNNVSGAPRNNSIRNNSLRVNSISSSTKKDSPPKPLKSILKNISKTQLEENELKNQNDKAHPEENHANNNPVNDHQDDSVKDSSNHPYKSIGKPLSEPPKFAVPDIPKKIAMAETIDNRIDNAVHSPVNSQSQSPTLRPSPTLRQSPTLKQSPTMKHSLRTSPNSKQSGTFRSPNTLSTTSPPYSKSEVESSISMNSPSNSIKFDEKVETIPIYDSQYDRPKETNNQDLYNKAMEVAMEKVYGSPNKESEAVDNIAGVPDSLIEKKNKQDKKLEIIGHSGVNDNYKYENHHKDFAIHSLRDNENKTLKSVSRKDRAKEEKKQQKEYENRLKQEEKQRKLEMKRQAKEEAKSKKLAEKEVKKASPKRSIFGRRKKDNTDVSTLGSEASNFSNGGSPNAASPIGANTSTPQSYSIPFKQMRESEENHEEAFISPTRNNEPIPEDDVLHPVPNTKEETGTIIEEESNGVQEKLAVEDMPLTTPQIEPTIRFDPSESKEQEPPINVEGESAFVEQRPSISQTEEPATKELTEKEIQKEENVNKKTESTVADNTSGIPLPILNDVVTDSEVQDDSALATEEEDNLQSPQSRRLEPEKFYETTAGDYDDTVYAPETLSKVKETEKDGGASHENETILEPEALVSEIKVNDSQVVDQEVKTEHKDIVEPSKERLTESNKPASEIVDELKPLNGVPKVASDENTSKGKMFEVEKHHNLADLIAMGQSQEHTEDSFVPPDAHYDSDSDVSSKFSSDLNAALRRITDDKGNVLDDSEALGLEEDNDIMGNGLLGSSSKNVLDPPSNKSAPPTDSSDDRSPQPSKSTMATKEEVRPGANENFDSNIITNQKSNKSKTKKSSKFKSKVLKYFVNSYR